MTQSDPTPAPIPPSRRGGGPRRGARGVLSSLLLAALLAGSAGCTAIADSVARRLATRSIERELEIYLHKTDAFLRCVDSTGGVCPADDELSTPAGPPAPLDTTTARPASDALSLRPAPAAAAADLARKVLNHGVQAKINHLYSLMRGSETERLDALSLDPGGTPTLTLGIDELEGFLRDFEAATLIDGWEALAREGETAGALIEPADGVRRQYIRAYMRAYFRNGRFYQATLTTGELRQKLKNQIEETLPLPDSISDEELDGLVRRLFGELGAESGKIFGRIDTQGFVTRGGQDHKFPAVEAAIEVGGKVETTLGDIDFIAVGSDLLRVYLNAVFDAHDRIPSVSNATGRSALGEGVRLAVNDPETTKVDETEFERVEGRAAQVEGTVATAVGRLVRGIGLLSLNNEALATILETAVGVAARKFAEKTAWCWYACELDALADGDALTPESASEQGERIRFRIVVSSGGEAASRP